MKKKSRFLKLILINNNNNKKHNFKAMSIAYELHKTRKCYEWDISVDTQDNQVIFKDVLPVSGGAKKISKQQNLSPD